MVSVNRLIKRKSDFQIQDYMIDSGAFTRLSKHKSHLSTKRYAKIIRRWYHQQFGKLLAAVSQDYLATKSVLDKTGMSVADIQKVCVTRYDSILFHLGELEKQAEMEFDRAINLYTTDLDCDFEDADYLEMESNHYDDLLHQGYLEIPYLMPVLQGQTPQDYVNHIQMYDSRLTLNKWVGVGSLVRFSQQPMKVVEILQAIKSVRPDLRLHGFGLKLKTLRHPQVRELIYSADSAAAGLVMGKGEQRYVGQHDPEVAIAYAEAIENNTDFQPPPQYQSLYKPTTPPDAGFFVMNIKCVYHPGESIALTLDQFDPFETVCQQVQKMLESKKFVRQSNLHYLRTEFDDTVKTESFYFWLEQATKLCQKFGGNEPVGVLENKEPVAPASDSKNLSNSGDIIQQLVEQIAALQQEVESLKKFDKAANEKLRQLQQQLQQGNVAAR